MRLETLDGLIERFGSPRFVKIDVEGFEAEVVAGLSEPVPALSMEFHREHLVGARRWLDRLTALAGYRYQLSLGESMEFALPTWVTGDALWDRLRDLPAIAWGDAYARLGQI